MDLQEVIRQQLVQLARISLAGRQQDVQAQLRQSVVKLRKKEPALAEQLSQLLAISPSALSPLRDVGGPLVPVDADSRMALAKSEFPVVLATEPILSTELAERLLQVANEQKHLPALERQGLGPTRSLLFVGPPGVGKTMCARWLASLLNRPLITLDLATVMSSYLGKTGSNIRSVLEYAKGVESVLLLDEFDSIAKRRDDDGDIGELKRLVTVILQEVDDWPSSSLLIAATNHGELLDPAIWRRFDDVLEFDVPSPKEREATLFALFSDDKEAVAEWIPLLVKIWEGKSFSDLTRIVQWVRRRATITDSSVLDALLDRIGQDLRDSSSQERKRAANLLAMAGYSDRKISDVVGISRDTLRKIRAEQVI
jgi:SpoVK/Ycf46/Vps4 family AAA+-type ATPase